MLLAKPNLKKLLNFCARTMVDFYGPGRNYRGFELAKYKKYCLRGQIEI